MNALYLAMFTIMLGSMFGIVVAAEQHDASILGYLTLVQSSQGEPKLDHYSSVLEQAKTEDPDGKLTNFITSYTLPELCFFGPGMLCRDWQLQDGILTLSLYNSYMDLVVSNIAIDGELQCDSYEDMTVMRMGQTKQFALENCVVTGTNADLTLTYKKNFAGSFDHTLKGTLLVKE